MANDDHIAQLMKGVAAWNTWRDDDPGMRPDLSEMILTGADLGGVNFVFANLAGANLDRANLRNAHFLGAQLCQASLRGSDLRGATLPVADLGRADASSANLSGAYLTRAFLIGTNFSEANLSGAQLDGGVNLQNASFRGANLSGANLEFAMMVDADLTNADLTVCRVHGVSAWRLRLEGAKQQDLVITHMDEPSVTVDDIEVAQFIYLLLHNDKIRHVIDTVTSKAVLILGRFTSQRKVILDALREELRARDYVPILFDFDKPASRDITETISLFARMARFVVADITEAKASLRN